MGSMSNTCSMVYPIHVCILVCSMQLLCDTAFTDITIKQPCVIHLINYYSITLQKFFFTCEKLSVLVSGYEGKILWVIHSRWSIEVFPNLQVSNKINDHQRQHAWLQKVNNFFIVWMKSSKQRQNDNILQHFEKSMNDRPITKYTKLQNFLFPKFFRFWDRFERLDNEQKYENQFMNTRNILFNLLT